ncbi:MAG: GWxTD domain-containing protein [Candidatus Aminicenantales bacterium]
MNTKRGVLFLLAVAAGVILISGESRGGAKTKLDPESEKFYKSARLIMSGEENKIWNHLLDAESRKEFIKDFWEKRDPDPDTEENEFKREFDNRVAYANKHFMEGGLGMNTDRGRIWILMGPPDKFEEFMTHEEDTTFRGPMLWWIYYDHALGIEFIDERNTGQYKIRQYTGDFFEAMELYKLAQWVGPDSVFKKRTVKFALKYDARAKEIVVLIPGKNLLLRENDEGKLQVDLDFKFYIYENEGTKKEIFTDSKTFVTSDVEVEKSGDIAFRFPYTLKPGKNFVDVIIKGKAGSKGMVRKIFEVKATP